MIDDRRKILSFPPVLPMISVCTYLQLSMWTICLVRMYRCKTVFIYPVAESPYWTDFSTIIKKLSFSFMGLQYCLRVLV